MLYIAALFRARNPQGRLHGETRQHELHVFSQENFVDARRLWFPGRRRAHTARPL